MAHVQALRVGISLGKVWGVEYKQRKTEQNEDMQRVYPGKAQQQEFDMDAIGISGEVLGMDVAQYETTQYKEQINTQISLVDQYDAAAIKQVKQGDPQRT